MQDRKNFKSIFLVKLPMCSHPDSIGSDSFRTKNPFRPGPSLALPVLRAFLEKYKTYDYKIKAVDLNLEAYTEPGIPVDTSVYPNLLAGVIKNNDYDVLAISIMFVFNVRRVDDIVKLSRKVHPEAKIMIGGGYHLIDLADLPMPAWDYINIEGYFKRSGDKVLPIEGSRGCPYRCSYCTSFIFCGPRIRYKPVENLINEILEIKKRCKDIKTLRFIDDNLSFSKDWIKDFLTKIINLKLPLKLEIQNFSVKHLDEEIVRLLIEAGTHTFTIAVESGSPEMQKRINKNLNFNMVKDAVKMMKSHDVHIHICWMIGFPGVTLEQINDTFNFARELKANSNQFVTVLPYPGTQLFDEAKKANLLVFSEDDLDKFDNRRCDYVKSDQWNYDQLQKIIYDANIEMNFLNNPSLKPPAGRDKLLSFFIDNELLLSIPDHIILYLVIGYIYKQKNCYAEYEKHYNKAKELYKDEKLAETFSKYLSWDNQIIKDYNQFLSKSQ